MKKILSTIFAGLILSGCTVSNGQRTGVVIKLAQEGFIIKTYEAEIIKGGFSSGSGVMGQPFYFTISDKKLIGKIQAALDNQKEIKVNYHQGVFCPWSSLSGCIFADDIQVIK